MARSIQLLPRHSMTCRFREPLPRVWMCTDFPRRIPRSWKPTFATSARQSFRREDQGQLKELNRQRLSALQLSVLHPSYPISRLRPLPRSDLKKMLRLGARVIHRRPAPLLREGPLVVAGPNDCRSTLDEIERTTTTSREGKPWCSESKVSLIIEGKPPPRCDPFFMGRLLSAS